MDDGIRDAAAYARRFRLTTVYPDGSKDIQYYQSYAAWMRQVDAAILLCGEATYHNASSNYDVEKFAFRSEGGTMFLFLRNDYAK